MKKDSAKESHSLKKRLIKKWFSMPSFRIGDIGDDDEIKIIKHQNQPDVIDLSKFGPVKEGYAYIQMKLDVKDITPEFEKEVEKRISKQVNIRIAEEKDIPTLVKLYNRAFLSAEDPYTPMTEEDMKKIFHFGDTIILIASIWGRDVGFLIMDFAGEDKEIGIIAGLGTLPEWQKRGIGTTMGMASWKIFKEKGVKYLCCEVYSKNRASYNLIKGLGFKEVGVKYYKF